MTTETVHVEAVINLPLDGGGTLPMRTRIAAKATTTPGLVVFPILTGPLSVNNSLWTVTHAPTGRNIPVTFPDEASAERFAGAIGELGDWSDPKPGGINAAETVRIAREHGGTPSPRVLEALARATATKGN